MGISTVFLGEMLDRVTAGAQPHRLAPAGMPVDWPSHTVAVIC